MLLSDKAADDDTLVLLSEHRLNGSICMACRLERQGISV